MISNLLRFCVIVDVGVLFCVGNQEEIRYEVELSFQDRMCPPENVHFEAVAETILLCMARCTREPVCKSVIYKKCTGQCYGISLHFPCPVSTALQGAKFYRKKCFDDDKVAMVTGPHGIPDTRITATSWYDNSYLPHFARLHGTHAWATPGSADVNQYIQFDLGTTKMVTEIATKGFCCPGEWVLNYMLLHSTDCITFTAITHHGSQIIPGNVDTTNIVKHTFEPPIFARCFRLNPRSWENWATIQVEFYGCSFDHQSLQY